MDTFELIILWGILGGPFVALIISLSIAILIGQLKDYENKYIMILITFALFYLPGILLIIYFLSQAPIPGIISLLWTVFFLKRGTWDEFNNK